MKRVCVFVVVVFCSLCGYSQTMTVHYDTVYGMRILLPSNGWESHIIYPDKRIGKPFSDMILVSGLSSSVKCGQSRTGMRMFTYSISDKNVNNLILWSRHYRDSVNKPKFPSSAFYSNIDTSVIYGIDSVDWSFECPNRSYGLLTVINFLIVHDKQAFILECSSFRNDFEKHLDLFLDVYKSVYFYKKL